MNSHFSYQKAIRYLEGLANLPTQQSYLAGGSGDRSVHLRRMRYFLDLLGNPDRGMKFVHITGTSGKGSVTNLVHEMAVAAGVHVGSFTSPFVTTSIEKIRVGTRFIEPQRFADLLQQIKPIIDRAYFSGPYGRPTYFELFLAIALLYFKDQKCELVLLEVGLGGRYDSTNVIEKPLITAITNIDYDHMEILGNTLRKIAQDKMGIIKHGSVFFTTEKRPALLKLFRAACNEVGAICSPLCVKDGYQAENAALASAIAKRLGIGSQAIQQGIDAARLPCRFEVMQTGPCVVLDGAHNRAKIRTTVENIKQLRYRKLHLVLGFAKNKDPKAILEQVIPLADAVYITRFQMKDRLCAPPDELSHMSKKYLKQGVSSKVFLDPNDALKQALAKAQPKDLIVATGSFFLAGELREWWIQEETILKRRRAFGLKPAKYE